MTHNASVNGWDRVPGAGPVQDADCSSTWSPTSENRIGRKLRRFSAENRRSRWLSSISVYRLSLPVANCRFRGVPLKR
jgi:hypothetical protein